MSPAATRILLIVAAVALLAIGIGASLLFPPWQAERAHSAVPFGSDEKCLYAREASDAWARFGNAEQSASWRERSEIDCAMMRLQNLR